MNKVIRKTIGSVVPVLVCLASALYAQLEVRIEPTRRDFVPGENVRLRLTLINQTDAPMALTNTPGRPWLNFEITRRGVGTVVPDAVPRFPDLTLTPGSRRSFELQLRPYFNLAREGIYTVRVHLRMPDMSTIYSSNVASFNMTSGGEVQSFLVQVRGRRLKMSVRCIQIRDTGYLFGQVTDAGTRTVLGACCMAQYLGFMRPIVKLDRAQNLHLLCQSTPKYFTYAVMDTYGSCARSTVMQSAGGGRVDLVSDGRGLRCIGLIPYVKPTDKRVKYHTADERP